MFHCCFCQPKQLQRKKLASWNIEEVCEWLISLELEQYCETFRQNAIDGGELSHMTGEVLASDIGIGELMGYDNDNDNNNVNDSDILENVRLPINSVLHKSQKVRHSSPI